MFSKDAIETIAEAQSISAAAATLADSDTTNLVALPENYSLHDLEKHLANRRRPRGIMKTNHLASFANYSKQHAGDGASVFVDAERMKATAVLNLGTPGEPGHADDLAQYAPGQTAAYQAMLTHTASSMNQRAAAEFFEDWATHLQFFTDAGQVSGSKAIAAVRKITIENMKKLASSEEQLSANRSTFESVSASSDDPIPTIIYFTTQPYDVLPSRVFVLRLSINTSSNQPLIVLRVATLEKHKEEMALELADLVRNAFDNSLSVALGTYEPKA